MIFPYFSYLIAKQLRIKIHFNILKLLQLLYVFTEGYVLIGFSPVSKQAEHFIKNLICLYLNNYKISNYFIRSCVFDNNLIT